jgi:hypothetical protein
VFVDCFRQSVEWQRLLLATPQIFQHRRLVLELGAAEDNSESYALSVRKFELIADTAIRLQ